jgi:hypothetical protein
VKHFFELQPGRRHIRSLLILAGSGIVAGSIFIVAVLWQPWRPPRIPAEYVGQIQTFTPYFYPDQIPGGFTLVRKSLHYSNGVLVMQLKSASQTVSLSEQALPKKLAQQEVPKELRVEGVDGTAALSYSKTRTIGTVMANGVDGKRTLILLNTTDHIDEATVKDLMRALRPVR